MSLFKLAEKIPSLKLLRIAFQHKLKQEEVSISHEDVYKIFNDLHAEINILKTEISDIEENIKLIKFIFSDKKLLDCYNGTQELKNELISSITK